MFDFNYGKHIYIDLHMVRFALSTRLTPNCALRNTLICIQMRVTFLSLGFYFFSSLLLWKTRHFKFNFQNARPVRSFSRYTEVIKLRDIESVIAVRASSGCPAVSFRLGQRQSRAEPKQRCWAETHSIRDPGTGKETKANNGPQSFS